MSTSQPATTTPEAKQKAGTEYVLLVQDADDDLQAWTEIGTVRASSADAAIRSRKVAGRYVAIPATSFKPRTVTVETRVRLA